MCCPATRLKSEGFSERHHGFSELASLGKSGPQLCLSPRGPRIERDGFAQFRNCIRKIAAPHQECSHPVGRVTRCRCKLDAFLQSVKRVLIITGAPIGLPEFDIELCIFRLTFQCRLKLWNGWLCLIPREFARTLGE